MTLHPFQHVIFALEGNTGRFGPSPRSDEKPNAGFVVSYDSDPHRINPIQLLYEASEMLQGFPPRIQ